VWRSIREDWRNLQRDGVPQSHKYRPSHRRRAHRR
jgi:hypothetical protein